jgi:predicted RNase H-like nuclease
MSCARGCCASQADHYRSVRLFGPSQRRTAARQEEADMHAYKRLVASGVQPKQIAGSAELERGASTAHEVENTNIITDPQLRRKVTRIFESAPPPSTTPNDAA